ncbi:MAG: zinc ribbon domain-containing protein [Deltaproteobacteria bacterium]|nr:zinc ribbon domain-containing protein [Deltaproteobacteria bacterium]
MPIYEYRCESCGKEFEEWQKFSDPPVDRCGDCGGKARRLISQSTFVLKGTGWYVTDYGRSGSVANGKAPEKKEAPSSCASEGAGAGSSSDS